MSAFDPMTGQVFADNAWRPASSPERLDVVNPATLETAGVIAKVGADECEGLALRAAGVQRQWRRMDAKSRAGLLHRVARSIEDSDFREVAELMTAEMGKPYAEAVGELCNVASIFRYYAEMARDEAGKVAGTTQTGSFQYALYQPYGVSVHILPFNFPVLLMAWTLSASLAAGNTAIVKPALATSLCTLKFMEHFTHLPPGVVTCITGGAETAQALIASENTHVVAFTGGVETAKKVAVACAERLKPSVIEAGGNDAMIVTDSADLEVAAAGCTCAAFHLSGQICTSSERLFVQAGVHDAFIDAFAERTRALRIGHGLDETEIGPLVSAAARDRVITLVERATGEGARVVCGGRVPPGFNTGWYYEPTILADVRPDMEIMKAEVFGPVACVVRVADLDEALSLANRSAYGLGGCIFTSRLDEALKAAEEYETGMVWVNNPLIDNDALPFGGWKTSGMGRELGRQGLDAFRQTKMVVIDNDPQIQSWWYPYPDDVFHPGAKKPG